MTTYSEIYRSFISKYLHRDWGTEDGINNNNILIHESKLGITFPTALRELYLTMGHTRQLLSVHNKVFPPEDVEVENGYVIFMEENQSVVTWGIRLDEIEENNPIIWQRNNTENLWYSEEKTLTELLKSMFEWYSKMELLK